MPMLTVRDVAEALAVGRSTVYSLIDRQDLPAIRLGATYRIDADELAIWLRSRSTSQISTALDYLADRPRPCTRCGDLDQDPTTGLCSECHLELQRQADVADARRTARARARRLRYWHSAKGRAAAERRNEKRRTTTPQPEQQADAQ